MARLKPGEPGYGRPLEGSQTEGRAIAAQQWVDAEIDKLVEAIRRLGEVDSAGSASITFGVLFEHYAEISDTLVGILKRARKRKRLRFKGDMLYQGMHDDVIITLVETQSAPHAHGPAAAAELAA